MRHCRPVIVAVLLCATVTHHSAAQGVLEQLRRDVAGITSSESEKSARRRRQPNEYDDWFWEYEPLREWLGTAILYGLTVPFWGPPACLDDQYGSMTFLSCYPYQHEGSGYVLTAPNIPDSEDLYYWSLRVRGEYANEFDALARFGGRVLWESNSRFGIDSSLDYHRETLAAGTHDHLWTGDFNVVFRFAQGDRLAMRTGLGANYLSGYGDTDLGFNFTYAADWFPFKPFIVSSEIDWGWLGSAGLFHGRATVGVNIQNIEVYSGYDYYDVGSAQIDGVIGGIQVWY